MWNFIKDHTWEILVGVHYILALVAIIMILLKNINPTKTLSYIIVLAVFPGLGLIVYYFFGQDYRMFRMFKKRALLNQTNVQKWTKKLELLEDKAYDISSKILDGNTKIIRLIDEQRYSPVTLYNHAEILVNGEAKFKRLFDDIQNATSSIHMEYYIIQDDEIGSELIGHLCTKSKQGVEVKVNYDSVGSSLSRGSLNKLKEAGVEIYPFMPIYFPRFASKFNYRNHRKIIVIDGVIGYVGGINIADEYVNAPDRGYWRDTHLRIHGQAAGMLQLYFLLDWNFVADQSVEVKEKWFPKSGQTNQLPIQIISSGPDMKWSNIMEAMFTAINSARRYVYLTTPYFIPNEEISLAMITAAKSGVDVRLLIPKTCDSRIAKYATYSYLAILLKAGVKIYFYEKGNIHAKTIVADDVFSTIGTANMDNRSFHLNFEVNAMLYDGDTAVQMRGLFMKDLKDSSLIDVNRWERRGVMQRLLESLFRLLAPLL
ncbi:cardiolipin synthase [Galbibacter sp.]|jgi:cardiolipin synthase|uniref:cardiolipin synthase n=1 Tax=Galbibacter sp. TaxID=2918471 RepID=UPI003A8C8B8E